MFWFRRALMLMVCVVAALSARAFTVSYGNCLDVTDVKLEKGKLLLPLSREKYSNIKVLDKKLYQFLIQCEQDCSYDAAPVQFALSSCRSALTRSGMWIAEVALNQEWLITFLIFKNKDGWFVKTPENVIFKNKPLEEKIQRYLTEIVEKNKCVAS